MKTKTFFSSMLKSSLMLLAAVTISFAMTACSDDDDKGSTVSPYKQWLLTGENNLFGNENIAAMVLDATNPTTMAIMVKPSATFVDLDPDLFYLDLYIQYSITLNADGTSGTINIEDVQCPFKNLTANSVDVTIPGSESKTVHATVPSSKIEVSKGSFSTTDGKRRIIKSCAFYHYDNDDDDDYYNIVLSDVEGTLTPGKKPSGKWLAINIPETFADGKKYDIKSTSFDVDFTIFEDGAWYDSDDFASGTIRVDVNNTPYGYFVVFRLDGTLNNGKKISVKAFAEASKAASYIWPDLR